MRHVRGVFKKFLLLAAAVAKQTTRRILFCIRAKMEDRKLLHRRGNLGVDGERKHRMFFESALRLPLIALSGFNCIRMRLSRPVAAFTPGNVVFARDANLGMSSFLIFAVFRAMA
jgi:hypothetical protein